MSLQELPKVYKQFQQYHGYFCLRGWRTCSWVPRVSRRGETQNAESSTPWFLPFQSLAQLSSSRIWAIPPPRSHDSRKFLRLVSILTVLYLFGFPLVDKAYQEVPPRRATGWSRCSRDPLAKHAYHLVRSILGLISA